MPGLARPSQARPSQARSSLARRFLADRSGATAIEYGLLASLIAVAVIAILQGLGLKMEAVFTRVNTTLRTGP